MLNFGIFLSSLNNVIVHSMIVLIAILVILALLGWYFYRQLIEFKEDNLSRKTIRNNRIAILAAVLSITLVVIYGYPREDKGETVVVDIPDSTARTKDTLTQNLAVKSVAAVEIAPDSASLSEQNSEEKLAQEVKEEPVKEKKELVKENKEEIAKAKNVEIVKVKKEEVVNEKKEVAVKAGAGTNFFPKHRGITFGPRRREKLDFLGMNADSLEARLNAAINNGGDAKTMAIIQFYLTSEWLDRKSRYLDKARAKFNIDANNSYFNTLVNNVKSQSYLAKPRSRK